MPHLSEVPNLPSSGPGPSDSDPCLFLGGIPIPLFPLAVSFLGLLRVRNWPVLSMFVKKAASQRIATVVLNILLVIWNIQPIDLYQLSCSPLLSHLRFRGARII